MLMGKLDLTATRDMPDLDTNIVVYKVPLNEGSIYVKYKLRRTRPDMVLKVKLKIKRQWDAGF